MARAPAGAVAAGLQLGHCGALTIVSPDVFHDAAGVYPAQTNWPLNAGRCGKCRRAPNALLHLP